MIAAIEEFGEALEGVPFTPPHSQSRSISGL